MLLLKSTNLRQNLHSHFRDVLTVFSFPVSQLAPLCIVSMPHCSSLISIYLTHCCILSLRWILLIRSPSTHQFMFCFKNSNIEIIVPKTGPNLTKVSVQQMKKRKSVKGIICIVPLCSSELHIKVELLVAHFLTYYPIIVPLILIRLCRHNTTLHSLG